MHYSKCQIEYRMGHNKIVTHSISHGTIIPKDVRIVPFVYIVASVFLCHFIRLQFICDDGPPLNIFSFYLGLFFLYAVHNKLNFEQWKCRLYYFILVSIIFFPFHFFVVERTKSSVFTYAMMSDFVFFFLVIDKARNTKL